VSPKSGSPRQTSTAWPTVVWPMRAWPIAVGPMRVWPVMILPVVALILGGCGIFHHSPKATAAPDAPAGKPVSLTLTGKEMLNACGQGAGNALVVRVYALAAKETIQGLSLSQLWDREHEELKDDLIGEPVEVVLDPGGNQPVKIPHPAGAKFLAVAGNFCKTKPGCWLWIKPISDFSGSTELLFDESCIKEAR
jgi:type VI secretion system VasD/TssJ family lipoprotein